MEQLDGPEDVEKLKALEQDDSDAERFGIHAAILKQAL